MGSAVQSISSGIQDVGNSLSNAAKDVGRAAQTPMGLANLPSKTAANTLGIGGDVGAFMKDPLGSLGGATLGKTPKAPAAPQGVTAPQEQLQQSQIAQQQAFQANMPTMQKQMGDQLKSQFNNQLQGNIKAVQTKNSARGLGYGGLNAGQKMAETSREQSGLATGLGNINTGLENANQQMQAQALGTGVGIQNTNQQIQNQLYQQQLGEMQSQNSMTGSLMGSLGTLGILAALA
jgi:hypothetical protein